MVASEYETTQMYTQLAESTDNQLAPKEEKLYAKRAKVVEQEIKKRG